MINEFFFYRKKTHNEVSAGLGGLEMCLRDTNHSKSAVQGARGGGTEFPAILPRALRDGRKGDPLHKCCGKNESIKMRRGPRARMRAGCRILLEFIFLGRK